MEFKNIGEQPENFSAQPVNTELQEENFLEFQNLDIGAAETEGSLGKFKNTEALVFAYNNLQAEFTRKCQKLKQLEKQLKLNKVSENTNLKTAENLNKEEAEKTNTEKINTEPAENFNIEIAALGFTNKGSNGLKTDNSENFLTDVKNYLPQNLSDLAYENFKKEAAKVEQKSEMGVKNAQILKDANGNHNQENLQDLDVLQISDAWKTYNTSQPFETENDNVMQKFEDLKDFRPLHKIEHKDETLQNIATPEDVQNFDIFGLQSLENCGFQNLEAVHETNLQSTDNFENNQNLLNSQPQTEFANMQDRANFAEDDLEKFNALAYSTGNLTTQTKSNNFDNKEFKFSDFEKNFENLFKNKSFVEKFVEENQIARDAIVATYLEEVAKTNAPKVISTHVASGIVIGRPPKPQNLAEAKDIISQMFS